MACVAIPSYLRDELVFMDRVLNRLSIPHVLTGSLAMMVTVCERDEDLPAVRVADLISFAEENVENVAQQVGFVPPKSALPVSALRDTLPPSLLEHVYERKTVKDIDFGIPIATEATGHELVKVFRACGYAAIENEEMDLTRPTVVFKKAVYVDAPAHLREPFGVSGASGDSVHVRIVSGRLLEFVARRQFFDRITDVSDPDRTPVKPHLPTLSKLRRNLIATAGARSADSYLPLVGDWSYETVMESVALWSESMGAPLTQFQLWAYVSNRDEWAMVTAQSFAHFSTSDTFHVLPTREVVVDVINTESTSAAKMLPDWQTIERDHLIGLERVYEDVHAEEEALATFADVHVDSEEDEVLAALYIPLLLQRKLDAIYNENLGHSDTNKSEAMLRNDLRNLYDFYVLYHQW